MVKLTFYSKKDCWLCDMAEEMINGIMEKYEIKVTKVAIDSDEEIYEMYRYDIPVVEFRDGSTLHGRIRKTDFIRKLEENKG
ncbi:MAG: glutaredoxin family protein [Candidatus Mariimomonas ferrooxydans]